MGKINFKALTTIFLMGRRSGKRVDWTTLIAIFSTIVTGILIALYIFQSRGSL